MSDAKGIFNRDDLTMGLRALIASLDETDEPAELRIVGGAAIALAYNAARGSTVDIDAVLSPRDAVLTAAAAVADAHAWVANWLNDKAEIFLPDGFGKRGAEWALVAAVGKVKVYVASAEMLLAMKMKAAMRRGVRELNDLRVLLALTGVTSIEEADELLDAFYPADALTGKTREIVQIALDTRPVGHTAPAVPPLA